MVLLRLLLFVVLILFVLAIVKKVIQLGIGLLLIAGIIAVVLYLLPKKS